MIDEPRILSLINEARQIRERRDGFRPGSIPWLHHAEAFNREAREIWNSIGLDDLADLIERVKAPAPVGTISDGPACGSATRCPDGSYTYFFSEMCAVNIRTKSRGDHQGVPAAVLRAIADDMDAREAAP